MGLLDRFRRPIDALVVDEPEPEAKAVSNGQGAKSFTVTDAVMGVVTEVGWPTYGGHYGYLYRRQPSVRTVVDFLSRNVAQLNPKTYERAGNSDRVELNDHPLAMLLRRPNPFNTRYDHLRDTVADLAVYDRAYWLKDRAPLPRAVLRIAPSKMVVEIQESDLGSRVIYRYRNRVVPRDRLVVFSGYSPDGDELGVSPLETLRRVLEEEYAANTARSAMWKNGARPPGAIQRPLEAGEWSDEARARFRADLENLHSGPENAGRIPVLEDGMTWNSSAAVTAKDTEYIEGRKLTAEEVARAYGIPPKLLGMGGDTNNANVESFHRQLYQDVLGPILRMLQDEIELQLLPDFEFTPTRQDRVYVEFNLAEKLRGSFEAQAEAIITATGVAYLSRNEGRARLNLPRIDDPAFDIPITPLNVLQGGQPSVNTPLADPGTPETVVGQRALPAPRTKGRVPAGAKQRRDDAARVFAGKYAKHFRQQARAVLGDGSKAFDRKAVDDVLDNERWDRNLTTMLAAEAKKLTTTTGLRAAEQIDGVYDPDRTFEYVFASAQVAAAKTNTATRTALAELDEDEIRDWFETAKTSRAQQLGMTTATSFINFARNEAASQSEEADGQERFKEWIVTSKNSRHPEMDRQRVPVGENFSNGAPYPGHYSLGVDEIADCQCLLALA